MLGIYVLPTVEGFPPRALLGPEEELGAILERFAGESDRQEFEAALVVWNPDSGCWTSQAGMPLPAALGDAITAHAKQLGVEW